MIPLVIAVENTPLEILKVSADDKTKRHLENLGLLKGATITLISKNNGDVILKVKDGRLAINSDLATKIYVG